MTNAVTPAPSTRTRSTSWTVWAGLTDQAREAVTQATKRAKTDRNAMSARPASVRPLSTSQASIASTNVSVVQPHDVEKYPPWTAAVATVATTGASPSASVRARAHASGDERCAIAAGSTASVLPAIAMRGAGSRLAW